MNVNCISKKDAKFGGLIRYYTGKMCKSGHFSERYVKSGTCVECVRKYDCNFWIENTKKTYKDGASKICSKCKSIKKFEEFYTGKGMGGRAARCKHCAQEQARLRFSKRKKDGKCLLCDNLALEGRTRCADHAKKAIAYTFKTHGKSKNLFNAAKRRARIEGVGFTLTFEWVKKRVAFGYCELTGIKFNLSLRKKGRRCNPYGPSIDRRIAGSDYTPENCRVVVTAVNFAMNEWGEDIYAEIAHRYLERHSKREIKNVA